MALSRMELDGKGAGSPEGLVTLILKAAPGLTVPIPIEGLARQLDIEDIQEFEADGFEGGLITDMARSRGLILTRNSRPFRRRFTIGHELGHFLIPTHMPDAAGRFLCSREDMRLLSAAENDCRGRMEVEANRFSSLILMPPPLLRPYLKQRRDPDLGHMAQLAAKFEVSRQAMANAYAQYQGEILAFVFTKGYCFPTSTLNFRSSRSEGVKLCPRARCSSATAHETALLRTSVRAFPKFGLMSRAESLHHSSMSKSLASAMILQS